MQETTMGYYNPNLVQIPLDNFNYNNQSDLSPLQEGVRCSKWNPEAQEEQFTKFLDPKCTTLFEAFRYGAAKSHGGPCLGWRPSPFSPYKVYFCENIFFFQLIFSLKVDDL